MAHLNHNVMSRPRRSHSVPHSGMTLLEHRAPRPGLSAPSSLHHPSRASSEKFVEKHPWKSLVENLHMPNSAEECIECPPNGPVDLELQRSAMIDKSIAWSVLLFELFVTGVVLSFGIITFWFGTWNIYDLWMVALFGDSLVGRWKGLLTALGIGLSLLVLAVLCSRTRAAHYIYRFGRRRADFLKN